MAAAESRPDARVDRADSSSGKLIELYLYDVLADRPVADSLAGIRTFEKTRLPAAYAVLAAMPESGPPDATYSVAFDVNGRRAGVANFEPYYLTSEMPGFPAAWNAGPGTFEINASAYSGKDGHGEVMGTRTTTFEIL